MEHLDLGLGNEWLLLEPHARLSTVKMVVWSVFSALQSPKSFIAGTGDGHGIGLRVGL